MSSELFGEAITDKTMKRLDEYATTNKKSFTVLEKAKVAMELKNSWGKALKAIKFVEEMRGQAKVNGVSCLIYNATGAPLKFETSKNWNGKGHYKYPETIENGQWAGFYHTQDKDSKTSMGSLVYSGEYANNSNSQKALWIISWRMSSDQTTNTCDIQTVLPDVPIVADSVQHAEGGRTILDDLLLIAKENVDKWSPHCFRDYLKSCYGYASIGNTSVPILDVIISAVLP